MPGAVAYNPNDPVQVAFLNALAQGETGGSSQGYSLGVGGTNLSGASTDQYGFPQWQGWGGSHAAGEFQFQPATWDQVAQQHNLNFGNPSDQNAAAWYLAQDTYAQKTGGDLMTALQNKDYASVQSALTDVWPSVTGNAAAPGGLVDSLTKGISGLVQGGNPLSADTSSGGQSGGQSGIAGLFVRGGLIVVGVIILIVALWKLLSDQGVVPSPTDAAKTVAKVAAVA